MPSWGTARARRPALIFTSLAAAVLLSLVLSAGPAAAASTVRANATVTGCGADHMTVVGAVKGTGRKVRGAVLQLRFSAMPLFGLPKFGNWQTLGKKTKGSGQQVFTGLAADNWAGFLSWRFVKGRKTVASGDERSQPGRVGSVRGIANCTLAEGLKPLDTVPPTLYITPLDDLWHHGPASVLLYATDDYTGVRSVTYSIDGGPVTPIANGGTFQITTEGAHTIHWTATDVAGNSASRDAVLRVDTSAPSQPVLTNPPSPTAFDAPTFNWTASTDSGSGLKGYLLEIKSADGSIDNFTKYGPDVTSTPSPLTLTDGQTYTATVYAVDNTDTPFTTASPGLTFTVKKNVEVTGFDPPSGTVLSFSKSQGTIAISLDRPADRSTVTKSTVQLVPDPATSSSFDYAVACGSPCTTITVTLPNSGLPEGRYALTVNGVKSTEGAAFNSSTANYAVPSYENNTGLSTTSSCSLLPDHTNFSVTTAANNENGLLQFAWSGTGQVTLSDGGATLLGPINLAAPGGGPNTYSFAFASGTSHNMTLTYCRNGTSGTFSLSGVWVSRAP